MISFTYRHLTLGANSINALVTALPLLGFAPGMDRGFSLGVCDNKRVLGRYVYKERSLIEEYDDETLELRPAHNQRQVERRMVAPFAMDFQRNLLRVNRSPDIKVLYEALDAIPGVHLIIEPLQVNLNELHAAFARHFKKTTLNGLSIADVLHDEALIGSPSFELIEEGFREKVIEKYGDKLKALTFRVRDPDGAHTVKLTAAGGISFSDSVADPDGMRLVLEDMVLAFHDPAVETVPADKVSIGPDCEPVGAYVARATAASPNAKRQRAPLHLDVQKFANELAKHGVTGVTIQSAGKTTTAKPQESAKRKKPKA